MSVPQKLLVVFALITSPTALLAVDQDSVLVAAPAQVSLIKNASIAAPIEGVIAEVNVAEGDRIAVDAPLVRLDASRAKTELSAALATLEAARIQSTNDVDERYAQRTLNVSEREYRQGVEANRRFADSISEIELDRLRLVVKQSELAIEQAVHEREVADAVAKEKAAAVRIAETQLDKHAIRSTIKGLVAEVMVQPGEWVDPGKPIVRVISLDPVRVECFVDGRKFGRELVGKEAVFQLSAQAVDGTLPATGKEFRGTVTFVSPELQSVTGQVRVWATIPNAKRELRAGMTGKLLVLKK